MIGEAPAKEELRRERLVGAPQSAEGTRFEAKLLGLERSHGEAMRALSEREGSLRIAADERGSSFGDETRFLGEGAGFVMSSRRHRLGRRGERRPYDVRRSDRSGAAARRRFGEARPRGGPRGNDRRQAPWAARSNGLLVAERRCGAL